VQYNRQTRLRNSSRLKVMDFKAVGFKAIDFKAVEFKAGDFHQSIYKETSRTEVGGEVGEDGHSKRYDSTASNLKIET
jgi:hypothetical protein